MRCPRLRPRPRSRRYPRRPHPKADSRWAGPTRPGSRSGRPRMRPAWWGREAEMKATNRIVILGLGVAVLAAAAWFLVLSPKRQDAATLGEKVERLEASIAQHEQTASYGEEARRAFPRTYQQLVVLGKAVPAGDDTSAMLVELSSIASDADVEFRGIELDAEAIAEAPAPVPPPTEEQPPAEGEAAPVEAPAPAPAPETSAANLPIGSS